VVGVGGGINGLMGWFGLKGNNRMATVFWKSVFCGFGGIGGLGEEIVS